MSIRNLYGVQQSSNKTSRKEAREVVPFQRNNSVSLLTAEPPGFKSNMDTRRIGSCLLEMVIDCEAMVATWRELNSNVQKWLKHRLDTIKAMEETASHLDFIQGCSNVAQCVGGAIAIAGAVGEIFGTVMGFKNENVREISKIAHRTGSAVAVAAPMIEHGLSTLNVKKVQHLLKEDEKLLMDIQPYFKHTRKFDEMMKKIFGIGIMPSFEIPGKMVIMQIFEVYKQGKVHVKDVLRALEKSGYDHSDQQFQRFAMYQLPKIIDTIEDIFGDVDCCKFFNWIETLISHSPSLMSLTQSCVKVIFQLSIDGATSLIKTVASNHLLTDMVLTEASRCSPVCSDLAVVMTSSIGIAIKVYSIMSIKDEVMKGTPSEYSILLRDITGKMIEELQKYDRSFSRGNKKTSS